MRAISISLLTITFLCADDSLTRGLEAFHAGRYTEARQYFEKSTGEEAHTFLALTEAATGNCTAALPQLTTAFTHSTDATVRKLAGQAVVSCVESSLNTDLPADADVLYQSA